MRSSSTAAAPAEAVSTVSGWLSVTLVVLPVAAWLALLVAGTMVMGPAVLLAATGTYLLGGAALVAVAKH